MTSAEVEDELFSQQVKFTLANNPLVNRMWVDVFENATYVSGSGTTLVYSANERGYIINTGSYSGVLKSQIIQPDGVFRIRYLLGAMKSTLPAGCTLVPEVTSNGQNFYPLTVLGGEPAALATYGSALQVRFTMTRSSLSSVPVLRGYAAFFQDYYTGQATINGSVFTPPGNYDGPA
jgi:hypothetical protein